MDVHVSVLECAWLRQAAINTQDGRSFAEAQQARALARRLDACLPEDQAFKAGGERDIALTLNTAELNELHHQLANGTRWPYSKWDEDVMTNFGDLIERMAAWLKDSQATDAFDALPESEKRKALAQANKEQK